MRQKRTNLLRFNNALHVGGLASIGSDNGPCDKRGSIRSEEQRYIYQFLLQSESLHGK